MGWNWFKTSFLKCGGLGKPKLTKVEIRSLFLYPSTSLRVRFPDRSSSAAENGGVEISAPLLSFSNSLALRRLLRKNPNQLPSFKSLIDFNCKIIEANGIKK